MCGIAGYVDSSRSLRPEALARALQAIAHRGPDDCGMEIIDAPAALVGLANRRLAILDLSPAGHQPMRDCETDNWIVFNGEIYNFHEVGQMLQTEGVQLRTRSDTEVILKAYARWGTQCLQRFRGMFAFALWDAREQLLFMARDRVGEKPFYFYEQNGLFMFTSELRALLRTGRVPHEANPAAIRQFLLFGSVYDPLTIIRDIHSLPPAHYAIWKDGVLQVRRYWGLDTDQRYDQIQRRARQPLSEIIAELSELLRSAVALRMVSDVPVGLFLSGGIDSSAIAGLLSVAGQKVKSFSVVFKEQDYTEQEYARAVARHFGTEHHEVVLTGKDALEMVPSTLAAMDQPTIDGVNSYVVSREAHRSGMKVALSGLGGDEVFGGYSSFRAVPRYERLMWLAGCLSQSVRKRFARMIRSVSTNNTRLKLASLLCRSLPHPYFVTRGLFVPEHVDALMKANGTLDAACAPLLDSLEVAQRLDPVNRVSYLELCNYMPNTLLRDTDVMSMAHGLEVRAPLVDHILIEYLFTLSGERKLDNAMTKHLLVRSLGGLLPSAIVQRPKRGFSLPFEHWLRNELHSELENTLMKADVPFLDPGAVRQVWRDFNARRTTWSRPWALYVLHHWIAAHAPV